MSRRVYKPKTVWPISNLEDSRWTYAKKFAQCNFERGQEFILLRNFIPGERGFNGTAMASNNTYIGRKVIIRGYTSRYVTLKDAISGRALGNCMPYFVLQPC